MKSLTNSMKTLLVISTLILFLFSSNSCSKKETVKEEEDINITGTWQNVSGRDYKVSDSYTAPVKRGTLFHLSILFFKEDGTMEFCSAKFFLPIQDSGSYSNFDPFYCSYERGNGTYNYVNKKIYVSINENEYKSKDCDQIYVLRDAFKFSSINGSSVEFNNNKLIIDKKFYERGNVKSLYDFRVDPLEYVKERYSSYIKNYQRF